MSNKEKSDIVETSEIQKIYTDEEILEKFFTENQMSEYIDEFKKQKIFSFDMLKELTENDLRQLGVESLGDRKRMVKLFSANQPLNFKNEILYSNLSISERTKLDLPENKILKKNEFKFKGIGASNFGGESGSLTLYENRILWRGELNEFVIPIVAITDVSVSKKNNISELKITDDIRLYIFFMTDKMTALNSAAAFVAGGVAAGAIAGAIGDTKIMTDIEYWRVLIEKQRERNIPYFGTRGREIVEPADAGGLGFYVFIMGLIIVGIAGLILFPLFSWL